MKILRALLLLPFLLGACAAPRPTVREAGVQAPEKRIEVVYPDSFRAQHRVTLTFRGKQLDFTGYLLVRRPDAWRAVAFGEFGGSLFDIADFPGRGFKIIKNPGEIRESWLTGPAAEIMRLLYLPPVAGDGDGYEISYSNYTGFPGAAQELPCHTVVENKGMRLKLEIDLVKFEPMELPDKFFDHD